MPSINSVRSGDWDSAATWSTNTVPASSDDVVVSGTATVVTVSGADRAKSVVVNGASYSGGRYQTVLYVPAGHSLTLGDDTTQGALTIQQGALSLAGTLAYATYSDGPGISGFAGGSFKSVEVVGTLSMTATGDTLSVTGLSFASGTVLNISGATGLLDVLDTETWSGVRVILGHFNNPNAGDTIRVEAGAQLTLSSGTLAEGGVGQITGGGVLINRETISVSQLDYQINLVGAAFQIATASFENDGQVTLAGLNAYTSYTVSVQVTGPVTGTGSFVLDGSSVLELRGPVGSGQTVSFSHNATMGRYTGASTPSANVLILDAPGVSQPTAFAGTLVGVSASDTIDLTGVAYGTGLSASVSGGVLTVSKSGITQAVLHLDSSVADGSLFALKADGAGGTDVNVACYAAGSSIRTREGDCPVERLRPGDLVLTAGGTLRPVRWIGHRCYAGRFLAGNRQLHPVRFHVGSLGHGLPRRDLMVSPCHAMFLNGVLVPAGLLVNSSTIVQERSLGHIEYFHVELDSHDILLAEGAPSESFVDDDSRGMFRNAAEWAAMYPGRERVPAVFCAPRVKSGSELEAIRRRLDEVAGLSVRAA